MEWAGKHGVRLCIRATYGRTPATRPAALASNFKQPGAIAIGAKIRRRALPRHYVMPRARWRKGSAVAKGQGERSGCINPTAKTGF